VIVAVFNAKGLRHERAGGGQAPGALQHIIIRGIERKRIFFDDGDRNDFLDRLGNIQKNQLMNLWTSPVFPLSFRPTTRNRRNTIIDYLDARLGVTAFFEFTVMSPNRLQLFSSRPPILEKQ
jgi:hypothetical protein